VLRAPVASSVVPARDVLLSWFDAIVLRIDGLAPASPAALAAGVHLQTQDTEKEEAVESFWSLPHEPVARLVYMVTFPLAAPIHLTTPDARRPHREAWYPATLAMSLVWLIILATAMTTCLDALGCLLSFSSTVMGLTLGAIGTSFPNLYASVLAARQGEAGMAVVQAFAANVFNICVALGFLWLLQSTGGQCDYGGDDGGGWCAGCYLPDGVSQMPCPDGTVIGNGAEAGSLKGTILFTAACVIGIVAILVYSRGALRPLPAMALLGVYALYAAYEVAAQRGIVEAICFGNVCI
jgi:Ca2+/Na+ antiporter